MPSLDTETFKNSVSVVIATYNRPDALVAAIRSVQAQTLPVHEIIVVGDCCDEGTSATLSAMGDERIHYLNLSERHGDQSFPNAVGVELATGTWIAFLNHDDVWFPHHVETLLSTVRNERREWVLGSTIFCSAITEINGRYVPVITQRDLESRTMWEAYGSTLRYLEPVSAWLVSREGLRSAGSWKPASESIRTPASRLGIRLWRTLGNPGVSDEVTVLKIQGSLQKILGQEYHSQSTIHRDVTISIEENPNEWFVGLPVELAKRKARNARLESNWPDSGVRPLPRPVVVCCAVLFLVTGFDFLEWRLRRGGVRPGELMDEILKGRTGEDRVSWKPHRRKGLGDDGN